MASTAAPTGAIGVNGSLRLPPAPAPAAAAGLVPSEPPAASARVSAPAPPSRARRLSAAEATSRKCSLSLVLGTGWAHASPQRRWQVTGLRRPWVRPAHGQQGTSFGRDGHGWGSLSCVARRAETPGAGPLATLGGEVGLAVDDGVTGR